jgi:hypothetical protein
MSVYTAIKKQEQSRVPNSQHIKTENKPDEAGTKPADPVTPTQPEAK